MRPDITPRRLRRLLLTAIAVLLCTTGLVAGVVEPASAAPKPAKVKGVKLKKPRVDGTTASFKVTWKRAARATSYKVQWWGPDGRKHKDRTRSTKTTIARLAQGTDYCVRVRAFNGKRKGRRSRTACRTTARLDQVQPVWVDAQQVQGASVALTFRWNEVAGATSYDFDYVKGEAPIQGHKRKKRVQVAAAGSGTASLTIGGFEPGRTYCFQVRPSGPRGVGAFATAGCKYTTPLSRATGGPVQVNVMTWNVCSATGVACVDHPWADRAEPAKARIAAIAPDAVALQESSPAVDLLDDVPGYARACQVGDGSATNPHPDLTSGRKNQSLIVRTAKFAIVPGTANGMYFANDTHGGCWVRVKDLATSRELILASVHLIQPSAGSDQRRGEQMQAFMLAMAADVNTFGLPMVIAGDFNSDRNSGTDAPREYLNLLGYDDAYDVAGRYNALPYVNSFNGWSTTPRILPRWGGHIDRVFVPPNARVTSWQTESPFSGDQLLSDHSPVRATVEIP